MQRIVLFLFFFILFRAVTFAQATPSPSFIPISVTPIPPQETSYDLPYPGILPDNPLYFLKAARDRVVSILVKDPVKKAEFDLLTSDKRVHAAEFLANKKKDDLVVSTISKGNNYFEEAIQKAEEANQKKYEVGAFFIKLHDASKKHAEIMNAILKNIDPLYKKQLQNEIEKNAQFLKRIEKDRSQM